MAEAGPKRPEMGPPTVKEEGKLPPQAHRETMIFERISEMDRCIPFSQNLRKATAFLAETHLEALPAGRVEIDGDAVYGTVVEKAVAQAPSLWEAHRKYIDVHVLLAGGERIGYIEGMAAMDGAYNEETDAWVTGQPLQGSEIPMEPGFAAVIFPGELHQPMIPAVPGGTIKKIILKVLDDRQP